MLFDGAIRVDLIIRLTSIDFVGRDLVTFIIIVGVLVLHGYH